MTEEAAAKVSSRSFYSEWHGHKVKHLKLLLPRLRENSDSLIWTAGDSSLDNKYWFGVFCPAVGVYQDFLDPPTSVADVTYWLNYFLVEQQQQQQQQQQQEKGSAMERNSNIGRNPPKLAAINTAVEATTLNE